MANKSALCILCRKPHSGNILLAEQIIKTDKLDVIFIIDEPSYTPPADTDPRIQFIHIDDQTCMDLGFKYSSKYVSFSKDVIAWDKAFYYFGCKEHSYDFVWLMEDDVFIPSTNLLCKMTDAYSSYDLVMGHVVDHDGAGRSWTLWEYVKPYMNPPYKCGRVCGVGVSKELFKVAADFIKEKQRIPFVEGFIPSIAAYHNLKTVEVFELFGIIDCLHRPMCSMPFQCGSFGRLTIDDFITFSKHNPTILLHGIKTEADYCRIFHEVYNKYLI